MTKERYIQNQRILQTRLMNAYYSKIVSALQVQIDHAKNYIRQKGVRAAQGNVASMPINAEVGKVIKQLYYSAAVMSAKKLVINKKAGFGANEDFIAEVMQYLEQYLLNKAVVPISQTMTDEIETLLREALSEGWSSEETVSRLDEEDIPKARARTIVRTESVRALNYTQLAAADNEFYEVDKQWIAIEDNRTRHSHSLVDGEKRALDDQFSNGLMFPGDPEGGPEEVINCFLPDEISKSNPKIFRFCFRSIHKGEVITIETSTGNKFTCTLNHPILTNKGWIAAGKLTEEFKLMKSHIINSAINNFYVENIETTFEQIFNSFSNSRNTVRIGRRVVNFHGDIPKSDVDIVSLKSHLHDSRIAIGLKKIESFFFPNSNFTQTFLFFFSSLCMRFYKKGCRHISNFFISIGNQFFSLFQGSFFHSFKHRIASISQGNIIFFQPMLNNISGATKFKSKSLDADSIIEQLTDFNFINNSSDWVVKCSRHNYEGFVYTLSTDSQMYDINGYVARNCRCTLGYFTRRDANGKLVPKKEPGLNIMSKLNIGRLT